MTSRALTSSPEIKDDDESIIQRRVIFDESMEDSYINLLQKLIIKWVLTDYASAKECDTMYNSIMFQLSKIYAFRKKSELVRQRISEDTSLFSTVGRTMNEHVVSITNTIKNTEKLLEDASKEDKRSENVKKLVAEVASYPSVSHLILLKKQQEEKLSEMTQTFERVLKLQQKLDRQFHNLPGRLKSCAKEIEQINLGR